MESCIERQEAVRPEQRAMERQQCEYGEQELRRYRGLLILRPAAGDEREETLLHWSGEEALSVPAWRLKR